MTTPLYLASSNENFLYLGTDFRLIKAHVIDDACDNVWLNQSLSKVNDHSDWLKTEFNNDLLLAVQHTPFTTIQQIERKKLIIDLQNIAEPCLELAQHVQILKNIQTSAPQLTRGKIVFDSDDIIENWLAPNFAEQFHFQNRHWH